MTKHRYEPTPLPTEFTDDSLWSLDALGEEVFGKHALMFRVSNIGERALDGMAISNGEETYALDSKRQAMRKYFEMPDGSTMSIRLRQPNQESAPSRSPMKRRMRRFGRKVMNLWK